VLTLFYCLQGIISLGANADTKAARSMLLAEASSPISAERVGPITAKYVTYRFFSMVIARLLAHALLPLFSFPAFKQRMTLFEAPRDIEAVLDIAKVCISHKPRHHPCVALCCVVLPTVLPTKGAPLGGCQIRRVEKQ
jgi:hypothetical protein